MIGLYDDFTHGRMDRAAFEAALAGLTGSADEAKAVERAIAADASTLPQVPADDPRVTSETVNVPGSGAGLTGLLARPAGAAGPLPGVLVIHENRGLNPHIADVTRRIALEGFLALGLDFLSPHGGTPADEDAARDLIGTLDADAVDRDGLAALDYLRGAGNGRVATIGYCWGGGVVGRLATKDPALDAAIVFYGRPPADETVGAIAAPLQLHYAGLDERINAGVPAFVAALEAAGKTYERHMYEGANHAFNNDASAARYDAEAAALAWGRSMAFLRRMPGGNG